MSVNHYPVPLSAADTISSAGPRMGPGRHPLPKEAVTTNLAHSLGPDLADKMFNVLLRVVNKANSEMSIISRALLFLKSQPLSGAILPKIKACNSFYIPSMCMWAVKALAIFRGCAGSSGPSLLAYAIGTIIS